MNEANVAQKLLESSSDINGPRFKLLSAIISGHSYVNDALTLAELIPAIEKILATPTTARIVSSSSFIGILLFPVAQIISLNDANNAGLNMYRLRAIAYGLTAWSFNQPPPQASQSIIRNLTTLPPPVASPEEVREYHAIWADTVRKLMMKAKEFCHAHNIKEDHIKAIYRRIGQGKAETLCIEIMKSFEGELNFSQKLVWKSNYKFGYPH